MWKEGLEKEMISMPQITVIMPALNVAAYISECMDSVVNQTLKDMEIIAVDAGSTDGTAELLEEYVQKDSRITLFHSEKKSYGYQLNLALRRAHGEYIGIVETDDAIKSNMYERLYEVAIREDADFVKANHEEFIDLPDGGRWKIPCRTFPFRGISLYDTVFCPSDFPELLFADRFLWRGIYKRTFLEENKVRLHETPGAAFQDAGFLFRTFFLAKKVIYLDEILYQYRRDNENSSIYNKNGFAYLVNEYCDILDWLFQSEAMSRQIRPYFYCRLFAQLRGRFVTMAVSGEFWEGAAEDIYKAQKMMRQGYEEGLFQENLWGQPSWMECRMFLENPDKYAEFIKFLWDMKRESVDKLIKLAKGYPRVVIRGCGKLGEFVHILLEKNHVKHIAAFSDRKDSLWGKEHMGKMVEPPEEAAGKYGDALFIIAAGSHMHEIKREMIEQGIPREQVYIYELGMDLMTLI